MTTGTVVITGAAGGMGRPAAQRFAALGRPLLLCDLDPVRLEALAEELRPAAGKVDILAADIAAGDFPARIVAALGGAPISALVHTAGLSPTMSDGPRIFAVNYDATERLLQQYLPKERVGGIMDEIRGPAGRNMWEKLANVQEEVLANYLKNEYPQTVAVVLSKLRPEHAARVLSILPEDMSLDCVGRMLKMEAVQKDVIERVEQTLRTEFMSNLSQKRRRDAHEVMAEIFNNFDRQTETRFLTALEEENRDAAERIKALMFTFDDLIKLDAGSAQTLMRNIDKDKLAIALKGANEKVREFFFKNMSSRAAKMLVDDMGALGAVRLRDVDEAQTLLVNIAKDLAAKGEILIAKSQGDDELIY